MYRTCILYLTAWLFCPERLPLVIEGAHQVGKTWIVRHLASQNNMNLVEINFEKKPELAKLFKYKDPRKIIRRIEERFSITIDCKRTILLLDGIQEKPELLTYLPLFHDEIPELTIIAISSLSRPSYVNSSQIPHDKLSYIHLEPLSFIEFLYAKKNDHLVDFIQSYNWKDTIDLAKHKKLMELFKEYIFVGGMPEAVANWIEYDSLSSARNIHEKIISSLREKFNKFNPRNKHKTTHALNQITKLIPLSLGKKFVYSHVDSTTSHVTIKDALDRLCLARICHKVKYSSANGVPLGAEINHKFFKIILLDVGLSSALLKLNFDTLEDIEEIDMINKGGIAEQVTGQLLRTIGRFHSEPALYYWVRNEKGSDAEIDFIIQHHAQVIPIEVKAGSTGTLKSLHLFMQLKNLSTAIRVYSGLPAISDMNVKDHKGAEIKYQLRSIPFYLISEIHRLLD